MMSLHSPMHSSQMYTVGPAISFFTSFWFLPQKEHDRLPWLSSRLLSISLSSAVYVRRLLLLFLLLDQDLVDHAVLLGLGRRHEEVALGVVLDLIDRVASVLGQQL